jgi:hypothetical protein
MSCDGSHHLNLGPIKYEPYYGETKRKTIASRDETVVNSFRFGITIAFEYLRDPDFRALP